MVLFYYNFIQKFNFNLFNLFAIGFLSLVLLFSISDYDGMRHSTSNFFNLYMLINVAHPQAIKILGSLNFYKSCYNLNIKIIDYQ